MPATQPAIRPAQSATPASHRIELLFPLALAAYFLIQVVIRVSQQGALELDEAEQVFHAQHLKLGYGAQPPLYTWLQWLVFKLVGVGHLGLSLLKNALLFGLYWSVYRTGRLLLGPLPAAAIAASLVLVVPLGWEAQIDRTHSILATTLAAASLWTYVVLLRRPDSVPIRLLLGLLLGLGTQSKYNFAIFALGLAGASLLVPAHRRVVWRGRAWLTLGLAALVLLPHGFWFADRMPLATAETIDKMTAGNARYASAVAGGSKSLLLAIISFATPWWLAFLYAYRGGASARLRNPDARSLLCLIGTGMVVVAALVAAGQLVHVKSRWLQPLLFAAPLAVCVAFPPRSKLAWPRLLGAACAAALLMTAALAARPALQLALGRNARLHQPYPALAHQIRQRFPGVAAVAVPNADTGGNLRLVLAGPDVIPYADVCKQGGRVLVLAPDKATLQAALQRCASWRAGGEVIARSGLPQQRPLRFHTALAGTPGPPDDGR